eukprot:m.58668 g.58668  ORF g.58668 m.58668 type:complete len:563 (+) comp12198_c0_seq1:513-2201(+)
MASSLLDRDAPYSELEVENMLRALVDPTVTTTTSTTAAATAPATAAPTITTSSASATQTALEGNDPAPGLSAPNDASGLPPLLSPSAFLSTAPMSVESLLRAQAGAVLGAGTPGTTTTMTSTTIAATSMGETAGAQWVADAACMHQYRERPSSSAHTSHRDSPLPTSTLAQPALGPGGSATAVEVVPQRRSRARGVTFGVFEELQMRRALAAANGMSLTEDGSQYSFVTNAAPAMLPSFEEGLPAYTSSSSSSHSAAAATPYSYSGPPHHHHHPHPHPNQHYHHPHPHALPPHLAAGPLQHSLSVGAAPLTVPRHASCPQVALNDSACMLDPALMAGDLNSDGSGWPSDMDLGDGDSAACSPCHTPSSSPTPGMYSPGSASHMLPGHRQSPLRGPGVKPPRRYPRSHTCREPERAEFASDEEFSKAWATWRQIRDSNNEAVRKSRNNKKALLGCSNTACLSMVRDLKDSEKTTDLLVKAALSPYSLTRAERKAYNRIIAARSGGIAAGLDLAESAPTGPAQAYPYPHMHAHAHPHAHPHAHHGFPMSQGMMQGQQGQGQGPV